MTQTVWNTINEDPYIETYLHFLIKPFFGGGGGGGGESPLTGIFEVK